MKKEITIQDFFFCYDKKIMKYIRYDKGIKFIMKAIHSETKVEFWLFHKTEELEQVLSEMK
ncbi:hypothetical protein MUB16_28490 [Priestia sp. OVL9]|nr:hypothetical protein [Priestia sp. OVL9]